MAWRYSVATGNWSSTSVWSASSGGAAGASVPGTGDKAFIETGTVTVDSDITINIIECGKAGETGALVINNDITFDDSSASKFIINPVSGFSITNGGSSSSPVTLKSAGGDSPTNRWTLQVYDETTIPDDRTLDFDYVEMRGHKWYLGNDDYHLDFNAGGTTDPFIEVDVPLIREPKLVEHYCEGRDYSRLYQQGSFAGTVTLSGYVYWESFDFVTLRDMIASKKRVSFFGRYDHLPLCRIERCSFQPQPGNPIIPFTITLVEDR